MIPKKGYQQQLACPCPNYQHTQVLVSCRTKASLSSEQALSNYKSAIEFAFDPTKLALNSILCPKVDFVSKCS